MARRKRSLLEDGLPTRRRGGLTVVRVRETRTVVEHVEAEGAEGHLRMMQDLTARIRTGWTVERITVTYRQEGPVDDA